MENQIVVELDWKFSPPDYFEEAIEIPHQDYTMTIADGQAHAKMDSVIYEANPNMREELHDVLNDWFFSEQLRSHRPYELSRPNMTRAHADRLPRPSTGTRSSLCWHCEFSSNRQGWERHC